MACTCRGLVPEQITKKSVNASALRRSSTTRPVAFFSRAASTTAWMDFGSRGAAFARVVRGFRELGVFAMQYCFPVLSR